MRKETTTTFTVTVTYAGPKKPFFKLFKTRGNVKDTVVKIETTKTENLPSEPRFSDEVKMVRLLIKKAAEAAGLVYGGGGKFPKGAVGTYNIQYDGWGSCVSYLIALNSARIAIDFKNGLNYEGLIKVDNKITHNFNLAHPDAQKQLTEIFQNHGHSIPSK